MNFTIHVLLYLLYHIAIISVSSIKPSYVLICISFPFFPALLRNDWQIKIWVISRLSSYGCPCPSCGFPGPWYDPRFFYSFLDISYIILGESGSYFIFHFSRHLSQLGLSLRSWYHFVCHYSHDNLVFSILGVVLCAASFVLCLEDTENTAWLWHCSPGFTLWLILSVHVCIVRCLPSTSRAALKSLFLQLLPLQ